jgi:hypothetical protein
VIQHTPGPWAIKNGRCIYGSGDFIKPFVASVEDDHNDAETAANARLIAASPELLDVAQLALRALNVAPRFKVPGAGDSYEVCSELERVLRKVEGAI